MGENVNIILSTDPLLKCINLLYIYNKNCIEWHAIILFACEVHFLLSPGSGYLRYSSVH